MVRGIELTTGKKILLAIGLAVLLVVLCVVTFIGIGVYSFMAATRIETRVVEYQDQYSDWQATGLVSHFPAQVPANASDVRFSTTPGFLQGGGHFQLHMVLPAGEVQALTQQWTAKATYIYPGGGGFFTQVNDSDGVATATYHTAPSPQTGDFPPDFTLYVLRSTDSASGPNPSWNHGQSCGVAINPVTNEVVYWAENW